MVNRDNNRALRLLCNGFRFRTYSAREKFVSVAVCNVSCGRPSAAGGTAGIAHVTYVVCNDKNDRGVHGDGRRAMRFLEVLYRGRGRSPARNGHFSTPTTTTGLSGG